MATGNIKHYLGCGLLEDRPGSMDLAPGALGIYHAVDTGQEWLWVENARWELRSSGGEGIPDAPSDGKTYGRKDATWEEVASGGTGNVTGPASSVADRIAVFNGITGKQIKDGGYTIAQLRALALISPDNTQTDAAYMLVLADAFKLVAMNSAEANAITVPPHGAVPFPVGSRIDLSQDGVGQTTIVPGTGVIIRTPETLKIRKRWGKATLIKRATDLWDLEGNLEAAP